MDKNIVLVVLLVVVLVGISVGILFWQFDNNSQTAKLPAASTEVSNTPAPSEDPTASIDQDLNAVKASVDTTPDTATLDAGVDDLKTK